MKISNTFLLAVVFILGLVSGSFGVLNEARDIVARTKEQYRDCIMAGDKPTNADMLPGESDE